MKTWAQRYSMDRFPSISRRSWLQLIALLIALLAAWPLLSGDGFLNTRGGGDSPFLLQRLHQLVGALEDGHFPVRWMPDANYGYGYPFFNYYAPLSIYVAALFRLAGFSYVDSLQLAQLSGFLLAAWATYRLAGRWVRDDWAALLATAAYTLAPFHMVNVYVRGDSLAEFWAMALYPVVLLAADRALTPGDNRRQGVLFLAIAYAALILTHNISALIFSPFLLLYVVLRLGRQRQQIRRLGGPILGALFLALALSSWFWLPALVETSLVQTEPITQGYFHYSDHFWTRDLVQVSWLFDYSVAGRNAFRVGLIQALLAGSGTLALIWHWWKAEERVIVPALFIVATLIVATAMITPISRPLWDTLPLLPFTQFPWRFLSVQALAGALATGALALLPGRHLRIGATITLILLLLVAMLGDLSTNHLAITDDDVNARRLAEYEWFTGNIGSTVSAEYLPQTVNPRPYTSPWVERGERNRTQVIAGEATTTLLSRRATVQQWAVDVGAGGATVVFPTLYWPGWQATIAGQPLPGGPATGSGLFSVDLPAGSHTLKLALTRTPVRLLAEAFALLALLSLLLFVFTRLRPRNPGWRGGASLLGLALLILLAAHLRSERSLSPGTLSWDFARLGYLHHAPDGILFSNGTRLLDYSYSADSVQPGAEVELTLHWEVPEQDEPATSVTVALASPAVHRYRTAPLLLAERQPLAGRESTFTLFLPPSAPTGLYIPRLTVADVLPLLPTGDTRGDLFLRPLQVTNPPTPAVTDTSLQVKANAITFFGETPARGEPERPVGCDNPQPGSLLVELEWATPHPLSPNYVASLRLLDGAGRVLAQCDVQPGYGFQPSSGWPAGQRVHDRLVLPLPSRLPDADPYPLVVHLYLPDGDSVLTRRLGEVVWQEETLAFVAVRPTFSLPEEVTPAAARFSDLIALRGYRLNGGVDEFLLTLYWEALAAGEDAYVRFVHLIDPHTGRIVERLDGSTVQSDGTPRKESYPTSQWSAGEIISDPVLFSLTGVPPGSYRLTVGFYLPQDPASRLPVEDGEGVLQPDGAFRLPDLILVPPAAGE